VRFGRGRAFPRSPGNTRERELLDFGGARACMEERHFSAFAVNQRAVGPFRRAGPAGLPIRPVNGTGTPPFPPPYSKT